MVKKIVYLGDPVLRKQCEAVAEVTDELKQLGEDMVETMIDAEGVGLAAPQIGLPIQMAVVDVRFDEDEAGLFKVDGNDAAYDDWMPLIFVNPELDLGDEKEMGQEGCLSIPDIRAEVNRPETVKAKLQLVDKDQTIEVEADGLLARAIQHEVDHLNGILFIDRLSAAGKLRVKRQIKRVRDEW